MSQNATAEVILFAQKLQRRFGALPTELRQMVSEINVDDWGMYIRIYPSTQLKQAFVRKGGDIRLVYDILRERCHAEEWDESVQLWLDATREEEVSLNEFLNLLKKVEKELDLQREGNSVLELLPSLFSFSLTLLQGAREAEEASPSRRETPQTERGGRKFAGGEV
jgi:hypothetical protein